MKTLHLSILISLVCLVTLLGIQIGMAHASETDVDKFHIGTVADGTYNETAALQRVKQLMSMYDEKMTEKQDLEKQLATKQHDYDEDIKNSKIAEASSLLAEINTLKIQKDNVQEQIDKITQESNAIQDENIKFYYMDPVLHKKYQDASDGFMTRIQAQYWQGKSFENAKKAFPLVGVGVDSRKKAVEITLWKGIENSTHVNRYFSIIKELMPKDIPWFVSFSDYPFALPLILHNSSNMTSTNATIRTHGSGSTVTLQIDSPLKQSKSGIVSKDVKCNNSFLIFKAEDGSPACVTIETGKKLVMRGWATTFGTGNGYDYWTSCNTPYPQSNSDIPVLYMPTNSIGKLCVRYYNVNNTPTNVGISIFEASNMTQIATEITHWTYNNTLQGNENTTITYFIKTGNKTGFYGLSISSCGGFPFAVGYDSNSTISASDFPWAGQVFHCGVITYDYHIESTEGIGVRYIRDSSGVP